MVNKPYFTNGGTVTFTAGIASQMNDGIVKFTVRLSSGNPSHTEPQIL